MQHSSDFLRVSDDSCYTYDNTNYSLVFNDYLLLSILFIYSFWLFIKFLFNKLSVMVDVSDIYTNSGYEFIGKFISFGLSIDT